MTFDFQTDIPVPPKASRPGTVRAHIMALSSQPIGTSIWLPTVYRGHVWTVGKIIGRKWLQAKREGEGLRVWKIAEPQ